MKATKWLLGSVCLLTILAVPAIRADRLAAAPAAEAVPAPDPLLALQDRIEKVADDVGASVVSITIKGQPQLLQMGDGQVPWEMLPPELRKYFNQAPNNNNDDEDQPQVAPPSDQDQGPPPNPRRPLRRRVPPRQPQPEEMVPRGIGSGIIISADGYIVTNQHVTDEAEELEVTIFDGRKFKAKIVGQDPRGDLAVVKIDASGLTPAKLETHAKIRRGMFVLAVGSPFGFGAEGEASVSFGIISGTGRTLALGNEDDRYYGGLLQTDTSINPGNSGGPLCDLGGNVIGVNVAIASRTGASAGVGFAIPINERTLGIIGRLKKGQAIEYGYIGVLIRNPTAVESEIAGAKSANGAFVERAEPNGPGEKAGLQPADLVVAVNGKELKNADDLVATIGQMAPGDTAKLTLYRSGKKMDLEVKVAKRELGRTAGGPSKRPGRGGSAGEFEWRGAALKDLTPALRKELSLGEKVEGVYVDNVNDKTPAAKSGLRAGNVIDQVGGHKVKDLDEFKNVTGKLKGPVFVNIAGAGPKVVTE